VLVVASFVIAIGYGIVAPALPAFARSFDVGVTAASTVVSAFAVFRLAFAPLSSRLISRVGELRVYCGGLVVVALSSGACAFAADYWQLVVFRAVGGVGSTMFTVSAAALLIRLAPPSLRGRATGAWATGFLLGTVAGPLVGGALITVSLRAPFLAYAVLLLLAVVISGVTLGGRTGSRAEPGPSAAAIVTFPHAFRNPTFRAALTSNFVHGWTIYGVWVALVPLYVIEVLTRPMSWSGAVLAVSAAGTALTLVVGGRLADSRGRRLPVTIGLAVVMIGAVVPTIITSLPAFLVTSLLVGIGTGLLEPPTNAAVADVITAGGATSGSALAGFQMVGDVGAVIGPVLAGLVTEATGYATAFALTAAIAAVSLSCWLRAPETLPTTFGPTPAPSPP
jgi:MFS family permease